jgi:hypothetical protein
MAQVPATPIVRQISDGIITALEVTNREVGVEYHYGTENVLRAPGVSHKWFDNPDWNHLYWVVIPEETSTPSAARFFRSVLEVFVVGAKRGEWPIDLLAQKRTLPDREGVQYEVAADIKRALIAGWLGGELGDVPGLENVDITSTKFAFAQWLKFAIVLTRWEIEFSWNSLRP